MAGRNQPCKGEVESSVVEDTCSAKALLRNLLGVFEESNKGNMLGAWWVKERGRQGPGPVTL